MWHRKALWMWGRRRRLLKIGKQPWGCVLELSTGVPKSFVHIRSRFIRSPTSCICLNRLWFAKKFFVYVDNCFHFIRKGKNLANLVVKLFLWIQTEWKPPFAWDFELLPKWLLTYPSSGPDKIWAGSNIPRVASVGGREGYLLSVCRPNPAVPLLCLSLLWPMRKVW